MPDSAAGDGRGRIASPDLTDELDIALARGLAGLEKAPALLLAVSGGPDSMALMHLAARWAHRREHVLALHVATVDHDLRAGSEQEAGQVASAAASLGLQHAILTWAGPKPTSRIQERARAARYALLADYARELGASQIVTAHHADDQAETVLLRLGRGSGIGGLAGMRPVSALSLDLQICRPFLDLSKADLVRFCHDNSIAFAEDPSNRDPAYARTRLRAASPVLAGLGLDAPGLGRFALRMARADAALEEEAERVEKLLQPTRSDGVYEIGLRPAAKLASETALRLVRRAVSHVTGDVPLRLDRLETLSLALWKALETGNQHRSTLAGTLVRIGRDGRLRVSREPERRRGQNRTALPD